MSKNWRRPPSRPPCSEKSSDDGIDPRRYFRSETNEKARDRKTLQLCGQAARAVGLALGSALDERLQGLQVDTVEPAPDARRLRVVVLAPPGATRAELEASLSTALPHLRRAVAEAIRRRKTPELVVELRHTGGPRP